MSVHDLVASNAGRYVGWLSEACSIPSLAGRPHDLEAMAAWLENRLLALGAHVEPLEYGTAPQAWLGTLGSGARSVLVYDHYDVQPPDPLGQWTSEPFSPEVRSDVFFARGAADNKGDLVARLAALEVYAQEFGPLPVTVKFLIEGEEETGSKNFDALAGRYGGVLAADGCIWEGNGIDHSDHPQLVFGAKGLAYIELTCRLLNDDQHSAVAVVAPSAAWRLIEALSILRSPDGRVLIDGFYDQVVGPSPADLAMLEALPFEEDAERARLGTDSFVGGARGAELKRRYYFEPTCNIAGIYAGFIEPGMSKTVLPREATAKIDMRLVPDQDPDDIVAKVRKHLATNGFGDIELTYYSMEHPVRSPSDSLIGRAAVEACSDVFDQPPAVSPMMIGTGPMYPIAHTLGIPTVSPAGIARPDSNLHAPNENIRIDDYLKIIEYTVAWLRRFGEIR